MPLEAPRSNPEEPPPAVTAAALAPAPARWPWRAATLVTLGVFNLLIFNRYFPLSEGWWEAYGYLYNQGLRPYRDFDLAFTPLFTIVNAGLLRLFGDSFFALRLFGVGVFLAAAFLLQLLLERLFSPRTAAVATLVSTFLFVSEVQFIAKDYHSYLLALVALSLLLHVWLVGNDRLDARRRLGWTFLLGATVALVFFLKQNVGALLLVAIAATLPLVDRERRLARLVAFGTGAALAALAMLPVVSLSDWRQLLLANDAKGDLGTVLGRFWRQAENRVPLKWALEACAAWAVVVFALAPPARWRGIWREPFDALQRDPRVRKGAYLGVVVLVAASGHRIRQDLTPWFVPVTLALLLAGAYRVARGAVDRARALDPRLAALVLPGLALAYANTTTAAFDFIAMCVPVAVALAWLLTKVEEWTSARGWFVAALVVLVIVPEIFASRLRTPYLWWGHKQGSVFSAVAKPPYPQLRGMFVTPEYRDILGAMKDAVDTQSRSRTDAYFFNLPVLYWLHGKLPPYREVVQWFDVVSSRQMASELQALEERPPRLVMALEPAEDAYAVHRSLKHAARLPQEDFRDLMDRWVATGRYRLVRSIPLPEGLLDLEGSTISQEIVVQNEAAIGTPVGALLGATHAGSSKVTLKAFVRDGHPLLGGAKLEAGDLVTARGTYEDVRATSAALGIARGAPRDWNTVNVYVRADDAAAATGSDPRPR